MCKDKICGELNIRKLDILNKVMLGKQLWRCDLEPNSLWRRIIQGKYRDIKEGLVHLKVREAFGVGLWKAIRRGWEEFSLRTHILVRDGLRTNSG